MKSAVCTMGSRGLLTLQSYVQGILSQQDVSVTCEDDGPCSSENEQCYIAGHLFQGQ